VNPWPDLPEPDPLPPLSFLFALALALAWAFACSSAFGGAPLTPASKHAERRAAVAAYDRMCEAPADGVEHDRDARALDAVARRKGKRPLRPPPGRIEAPVRTAAAAELAREIRRGTYAPPRAKLFGGEG
jgi:hypothetical protein